MSLSTRYTPISNQDYKTDLDNMAEYTLLDFDSRKVELGAAIGYMENGKIEISNFVRIADIGERSQYYGYVSFGAGSPLYGFTKEGECFSSSEIKIADLKIVDSTITQTTGTKIVKETDSNGSSYARPYNPVSPAAEGEETNEGETTEPDNVFSIATLQPREEVAMSCLNAMLSHYDNPLNIDNTKIKQLVGKSYMFAQEFINQAVLYREKETTSSTAESNKYASIDANSLSSDTDKLLYNIATGIINFMAQDKNQYAEQQKNGLKVNAEVSGTITTKQESSGGSTGNTENV